MKLMISSCFYNKSDVYVFTPELRVISIQNMFQVRYTSDVLKLGFGDLSMKNCNPTSYKAILEPCASTLVATLESEICKQMKLFYFSASQLLPKCFIKCLIRCVKKNFDFSQKTNDLQLANDNEEV